MTGEFVWKAAAAAVAFYVLGSIPFSYIIARLSGKLDIREHGSGNVGATNVGRVVGFGYGILAFALDASKGIISGWLAQLWGVPIWLAVLAPIGHNWSIFLKFTGGKGVATTLGLLLMVSPQALVVTAALWILITLLTQYVSLASIVSLLCAPVAIYFFTSQRTEKADWGSVILFAALGLLSAWKHRSNIQRLLSGQESKIFKKKQKSPSG
ncbi:glycerol-3-phosphate 1-O-acyltransferase PlsY [Candidatus Acetothermia bacterium]|nr:glycerol-3-phosphate 1-O-acyltransferase PlsY [Candidatus Acetothermia bacterium]MBI3460698.1 glycerol-3-phosphate 1-O-acyltransferase PlsY [Candidatus Acetothermia bacterium]MBI3660351.1 glycerol-3-phosphate 1-O-acyltransferase PlsY [Candidatus Acetothermia bacterium]